MHRSTYGWLIVGLAGALAAGIVVAQSEKEPGPPTPGAEHAKLAAFAGTWSGEAELKPGPLGPGGKVTWTETCDWFDGKFHLVCKSSGMFPAGKRSGMHVYGYDPGTGAYMHFGIDSSGDFDIAVGSVTDDGWAFGSERLVGDEVVRSRYVIHQVSPTATTFTYEMQVEDGGTWTLVMQGSMKKTK